LACLRMAAARARVALLFSLFVRFVVAMVPLPYNLTMKQRAAF
jgi:hypothetical protein